jgi:hypothetical protein
MKAKASAWPVTEYCLIKTDDLRYLMKEAATVEEYISTSTACNKFDCSESFLESLEQEGRIKPLYISDRPKSKRWPLQKLQQLWEERA